MPEKDQIAESKPAELWAVFCGDINAGNIATFVKGVTQVGTQASHLHILFQSWGGFVGDAVFLYNSLRKFPAEITLYNAGQVASAATVAYLGAPRRKTTANAIFMIHKAASSTNAAGVNRLKAVAANLDMDDIRMENILRAHLRLPDELWTQFLYHDVYLSGEDAVEYGLADSIGEFSPPRGTKVLNALG